MYGFEQSLQNPARHLEILCVLFQFKQFPHKLFFDKIPFFISRNFQKFITIVQTKMRIVFAKNAGVRNYLRRTRIFVYFYHLAKLDNGIALFIINVLNHSMLLFYCSVVLMSKLLTFHYQVFPLIKNDNCIPMLNALLQNLQNVNTLLLSVN